MAKALVGHIGGPDPRIFAEMRRLQERVQDLEAENVRLQAEIMRLQAENDTLGPPVSSQEEVGDGAPHQPALR